MPADLGSPRRQAVEPRLRRSHLLLGGELVAQGVDLRLEAGCVGKLLVERLLSEGRIEIHVEDFALAHHATELDVQADHAPALGPPRDSGFG